MAEEFIDYNSFETILLGISILICLSGIMFTGDRFATAEKLQA